jgi:hypothetical protein
MNRRRFLRITALGAASLTITGRELTAACGLEDLRRPGLLSVLGHEAVHEIGLEYRRLAPTEADVSALRAVLLARRGPSSPSIASMVRSDFEAGRTVRLSGWVLAVTEARQCALFSLPS